MSTKLLMHICTFDRIAAGIVKLQLSYSREAVLNLVTWGN